MDLLTPSHFILFSDAVKWISTLPKFAVVLSNAVVYSKYDDVGPFKWKFNGERKYQVDFSKSNRKMGSSMDLRFGFSTEAIQKQPISCIVMSKRNIWQKLCSRCRSQIFPVWSHEESVERGWLSPSDIWAGRKWQLRMMISKQWRMPQFGVDQSLRKKFLYKCWNCWIYRYKKWR